MTALRVEGRPDSPPDIRHVLAWRELGPGLAEAAARDVPIVCLAEPAWSNGAQRLALVLSQEDETRGLVEDGFVPINIDPEARPDLAARLRWAAVVLTGTIGPPLLLLLTPGGEPFLAYCSLYPEGRDPYPSLGSLLRSVSQLRGHLRSDLDAEARTLQARAAYDARGGAPPAPVWQSLQGAVDERFGGLCTLPKHPHAALLWRLLDDAANPPVREHLVRTLEHMQRGGILDQLGGSFHRCARDERWIVPHFEKLVPHNAALAAVYARAGTEFGRRDFGETAAGAAAFAAAALDAGVMAVASDTGYYTWTPQAFQQALDPAHVQALGLHFNITRDDSAHVLFRALDPDAMGAYADESADVLRERVRHGKDLLRSVRTQRPPPAWQRIDAPAWHAETLRWLFAAGRYQAGIDEHSLERHLTTLLGRPYEAGLGYARGAEHWLQDQAAIAAACLAAEPTIREARASAERLAELILAAYWHPESGVLVDTARGEATPTASQDVVDHAVRAAVPGLIDTLRALAAAPARGRRRTATARFGDAAQRIERAHRNAILAAASGG